MQSVRTQLAGVCSPLLHHNRSCDAFVHWQYPAGVWTAVIKAVPAMPSTRDTMLRHDTTRRRDRAHAPACSTCEEATDAPEASDECWLLCIHTGGQGTHPYTHSQPDWG